MIKLGYGTLEALHQLQYVIPGMLNSINVLALCDNNIKFESAIYSVNFLFLKLFLMILKFTGIPLLLALCYTFL